MYSFERMIQFQAVLMLDHLHLDSPIQYGVLIPPSLIELFVAAKDAIGNRVKINIIPIIPAIFFFTNL